MGDLKVVVPVDSLVVAEVDTKEAVGVVALVDLMEVEVVVHMEVVGYKGFVAKVDFELDFLLK